MPYDNQFIRVYTCTAQTAYTFSIVFLIISTQKQFEEISIYIKRPKGQHKLLAESEVLFFKNHVMLEQNVPPSNPQLVGRAQYR